MNEENRDEGQYIGNQRTLQLEGSTTNYLAKETGTKKTKNNKKYT